MSAEYSVKTFRHLIEGELHADEGENAILNPQTAPNGEAFWRFRAPISTNVVWMHCISRKQDRDVSAL